MDENSREHVKKSMIPGLVGFVVASLVALTLYLLEKRSVIESRKDWSPLAPIASGVTLLAFGLKGKNRPMIMSGSSQAAISTVVLVVKRRRSKSTGEEPQEQGEPEETAA